MAIGRTNTGGGAGLNFKVVGGTTQPTTASENTIWVNTDSKITKWIVDSVEPSEPVQGLVWFRLSSQASVNFNLIKKNEIILRIYQPKQYIGGAWVTKTASVYQYGEWNPLRIYVYNTGTVNTLVTSGIYGTLNDDHIYFAQPNMTAGVNKTFTTKSKVDLTPYSTMCIRFMGNATKNYVYLRACVLSEAKDGVNVTGDNTEAYGQSISPFNRIERVIELDISHLTGSYYLGYAWGVLSNAQNDQESQTRTVSGEIYEWWLE